MPLPLRLATYVACLAAAASFLWMQPVQAAGSEAILDRDKVKAEIDRAWQKSDWDALDQMGTAVVRQYENDIFRFAPYRTFFYLLPRDGSLATQKAYEQWVNGHPKSFAARYARSRYYSYLAMYARGGDFAGETSRIQMKHMRDWFAFADADARASVSLSSRPTLSYFQLMRQARFLGQQAKGKTYYEAAVALDPDVLMIAEEYLYSLQPRWGGDFDTLDQFPDRAAHRGLNADKQAQLRRQATFLMAWDMILYDRLDDAEKVLRRLIAESTNPRKDAALFGLVDIALKRGNMAAAITEADKLAALQEGDIGYLASVAYRLANAGQIQVAERYYKRCLERAPKYAYSLIALARIARDAKRPAEAIDYYGRALADWPEYATALSDRGWLRVTQSLDAKAGVEDLRRASELGDAFAQNFLGTLYWEARIVARDPVEAIYWWRQSADQGNRPARDNLKMARKEMGTGYSAAFATATARAQQGPHARATLRIIPVDAPQVPELLDPGRPVDASGRR
jgi:TPR repeat protein